MTDGKFDLVFRGELVPGADLAQVKSNLARLFKMDPTKVEKLFAGKAIVLKRNMDLDAAGKYRVAIKKAGARVDTIPSRPAEPAQPKGVAEPQPQRQAARSPSPQPATDAREPAPPLPEVSEVDGGLSMAPVGTDVLSSGERQEVPPRQVDTSGLSLREAGGQLVDDNEKSAPPAVKVAPQGLDLAPAGADVLRPDERRAGAEVKVDLTGLELAPPGDRLEAPKTPPPPAPDVSRLSLVDEGPK